VDEFFESVYYVTYYILLAALIILAAGIVAFSIAFYPFYFIGAWAILFIGSIIYRRNYVN